jgi:membrane protein DedA with SNARE-associated domain
VGLEGMVSTLGLPGIAVGVAIEGEGVAFLGGVLAHRGFWPVEAAAFAATLGAAVSDNAFFGAGRYSGRSRHVSRVLASGTVARLRAALDRHPDVFILAFRFIYGTRVASAVMLGTTAVPWSRFMVLNLVSVLAWAHLVTWLGYAGGVAIHRVLGHLEADRHMLVAVAGAIMFSALAFLLHRHFRRRRLPAAGGVPGGGA